MNNPNRNIVVCGFPRSGTSLTMQMLHAAGVRCVGEWPAFEHDDCNVRNKEVLRELMEEMRGGAIKILDPQIIALPTGFLYDFIWMRRNRNEQAASFFKFLKSVGMPVKDSKYNRGKLANSMEKDEPRAVRILRRHEGHRWYPLRFEDLINMRDMTCELLGKHLGISADRMMSCIAEREASCLHGMMELRQLNRIAGLNKIT